MERPQVGEKIASVDIRNDINGLRVKHGGQRTAAASRRLRMAA